ncbi:MAG: hypothetical protein AAF799_05435 [Myxococcota bacterium]
MRIDLYSLAASSALSMGCPSDDVAATPEPSASTTSADTTGTGGSAGPSESDTTAALDSSGEPGTTAAETTAAVDSSSSSGSPIVCGDGVAEAGEVCDGADLVGQDCTDQGLEGGALACLDDCSGYDLTGCILPPTCGDGVQEGPELCDADDFGGASCQSEGFDSGELACVLTCNALDTSGCGSCGNLVADGGEVCDGADVRGQTCLARGFDSGVLQCTPDCSAVDPSACGLCGNGIIDGTESCDGTELGGASCGTLGLTGGSLGCTGGCQLDLASCDIPATPFGSDSGYSGYSLAPAFPTCDDISFTGTATGLSDDSNVEVPMGFDFPLYGVDHATVNIQSNGTLRWGDDSYLGFGNTCLPTSTEPASNVLYVFWDDLNPAVGAGEVYHQMLGVPGDQRFVVQWDTANFGGDAVDLMRFQVVLHELTGRIDVCYVDTQNGINSANAGAEASAGIQLDSTEGLQFSCNSPALVDGLQLLYIPL